MKKVLVITYYWPPSGGGGVQRWLKFTKYLPEFGWEPVIYTPSNPQFENKDLTLLQGVGKEIKVLKQPIREPYQLFKKLFFFKKRTFKQGVVSEKSGRSVIDFLISWIRGNFFIPDPRVNWVKPSVEFLGKVIKEEQISIVITTGPPHSMHLIGLELKKKYDIKWVADFRDPWSDWDILDLFHLTKKSRKTHKKMEKDVVLASDMVITVSNSWAKNLNERYGKDISVITNGYDAEDFINFTHNPGREFRLLHAGLLNNYRNSEILWKVIEELLTENPQFKESFKLVLAGNVNDAIISQINKFQFLSERTITLGYIQHKQLMEEYSLASALLLLQNKSANSDGHIPAKFFEYLGTGIPILAIGNPQSDLAKLLDRYKSMKISEPENERLMKETLLSIFSSFRGGKSTKQPEDPSVFSRKNLTSALAGMLDNL